MHQELARSAGARLAGGARRRLPLVAAAVLAAVALAACSSGSKSSNGSTSGNSGPVTITTKSGSLGTYLTDSSGKTIYMFAPDTTNTSTCYGACASAWPPVAGSATAGSGVTAGMLTTITRSDGSKQASYNGHPLYYYIGDSGAGQTNGQNSNANGGLWWVLTPAGDPIKTG